MQKLQPTQLNKFSIIYLMSLEHEYLKCEVTFIQKKVIKIHMCHLSNQRASSAGCSAQVRVDQGRGFIVFSQELPPEPSSSWH